MSNTLSITALVVAAAALAFSMLSYFEGPSQSGTASSPDTSREAVELAALSATAIPAPETEAVDTDEPQTLMHKVVYHADFSDPRRFSAMLTSINNMVTTYHDNLEDYDVRIVFNSHGIRFVTDDALEGSPFEKDAASAERLEQLAGRLESLKKVQEVRLELCDITREGIGLDADNLYPGVELVPSGVVRLAELQAQGFTYIKVE